MDLAGCQRTKHDHPFWVAVFGQDPHKAGNFSFHQLLARGGRCFFHRFFSEFLQPADQSERSERHDKYASVGYFVN
jgi:hypothetical protein